MSPSCSHFHLLIFCFFSPINHTYWLIIFTNELYITRNNNCQQVSLALTWVVGPLPLPLLPIQSLSPLLERKSFGSGTLMRSVNCLIWNTLYEMRVHFTCFLLLRASRKWIVNLPFSHEICTDLHFLHPLHVLVLKCWFCPMDLAFLESFSICLLVHNVNHFLKDRWFRFLHFSSQWRSQSKKKSMQLVKIMHVSNLQHNSLIPSNLLLMIWQSIWLIG